MSNKQPVLFLGHGSPMNVIEDNAWTRKVSEYGKTLRRPDGIVVISAHWVTRGLKIHASQKPPTIHDFRGFPEKLYEVQYPAPSHQQLAQKIKSLLPQAGVTDDWGFDHGTWGVLSFLVPNADIPVVPVSLNAESTSKDFFELGQKLKPLRDENILILGSGNIVHNLREIDFKNENSSFPWAEQFDQKIKSLTLKGDIKNLLDLPTQSAQEFRHAHPSSEHWAPYIACLGAADSVSDVSWIYEGLQNGSISMRSARWG